MTQLFSYMFSYDDSNCFVILQFMDRLKPGVSFRPLLLNTRRKQDICYRGQTLIYNPLLNRFSCKHVFLFTLLLKICIKLTIQGTRKQDLNTSQNSTHSEEGMNKKKRKQSVYSKAETHNGSIALLEIRICISISW